MSLSSRLAHLTIRQKIVAAPLLAGLAFVLVLVIDYRASATQERLLKEISAGYFPAVESSRDLREGLGQIQRSLQDATAAQDHELIQNARTLGATFRNNLAAARSNSTRSGEEAQAVEKAFEDYFEFAASLSARIIARETGPAMSEGLTTMTARYNILRDMLDAAMGRDKKRIESAFAQTIQSQRNAQISGLLVIAVCTVLVAVLALAITRSITRPLAELIEVSKRLARGDLTVELGPGSGEDEITVLYEAFRTMTVALRSVLGNVSDIVRELSSNAVDVSTTARQAAATAVQHASTAAEVSASVEEIRQTSLSATDQAREVATVAESALQKGQRGQEAIGHAVEVIQAIGERVEGLAKRIMELNEKNAEIGKIVRTVNDMAEQSNLLAVNASIEAAKAGEHGRGFGVVASEVRNLAAQSKRATEQIGDLLAEIRAASSNTVMATEEASRRATEGRTAIESVRNVVQELAGVLEDSSDRAKQIAGATSQQAAGIVQIAQAMESSAIGSHEQAQASTQLEQLSASLSGLSAKLREVTAVFTA